MYWQKTYRVSGLNRQKPPDAWPDENADVKNVKMGKRILTITRCIVIIAFVKRCYRTFEASIL